MLVPIFNYSGNLRSMGIVILVRNKQIVKRNISKFQNKDFEQKKKKQREKNS